MTGFTYNAPTKVVFGADAELQVGQLIGQENARKVLVHYGGSSARKSGLLDRIERSLRECGIDFVELGGVVPNPRMSKVYEGISMGKKAGVDFVLAVGGGSVIDSAKAIAYGIPNEFDVWDVYMGRKVPEKCCPVGAVLTIAAAGSEMSNSSVLTNEDGWLKRSHENEICRCKFAVLNPELTYTLPDYQTACGCVDIMMHTMERYFSTVDPMPLTDDFCADLIRRVMADAQILRRQPENYDARAEVMWASSLSHNGLTGCGGDGGDWATHLIEHELGGMFDVAHGAGLAAVWGSWARYVMREKPERFVKFATKVMGCPDTGDAQQTALLGVQAMEAFFCSIGMPVSIRQMGLSPTAQQIDEMARKCVAVYQDHVGVLKTLYLDDVKAIYQLALDGPQACDESSDSD